MAGERQRVYIVLVELDNDSDPLQRRLARLGPGDDGLQRGEYWASGPKAAVEAAAAHGLPREDGGPVVAIPRRNWHQRVVGFERRPVVDTPIDAEVVD